MLITPLRIELEKRASTATKLEKDPEEWPGEILSETYKQHAFLSAFETDLEMQRVDQARGYAVGRVLVYPAKLQKEAAMQQNRLISLPVIVRDRELAPLDVYQHRENWHPMIEERVQEILYNPATFDRPAAVGQFTGTDLTAQIDPSGSDRFGRGGGGYEKTASVKRDLLKKASETFRDEDIAALRLRLREDTSLRTAFTTLPLMKEAAVTLLSVKEKTASAVQAERVDGTPPTVVQFVESGSGYLMKTANHNAFSPKSEKVTRFEVEQSLSKEAMQKLREHGRLTLVVDPLQNGGTIEKTAQVAERLGVYSSWSGGKEVKGLVIPAMVSLDGHALDLQIFAGVGEHAMQEKVAGVFERDVMLPASRPSGEGVFVHQNGAMGVATEPVVIHSRSSFEKAASYHGFRSTTGEAITLDVVPGLKKIASTGKGHYSIPDTLVFLPLNGELVEVTSTPALAETFGLNKLASADSVQLHCNGGDSNWLTGGNAHNAFSGQLLSDLDAEFALGALGVPEKQAKQFLTKAASEGRVTIPNTRQVVQEDTLSALMLVKTAQDFRKVPNLRVDLLKEAAILAMPGKEKTAADRETVDAVLSLGFITPENVAVYLDYLPELEKVSSKLAEILVASRLGMDMVKENAARNALTQISTVIDGLQGLQQQVQ